jgi:hypothetical protein
MTQPLLIALIAENYFINYQGSTKMSRKDTTISQETTPLLNPF